VDHCNNVLHHVWVTKPSFPICNISILWKELHVV
jgi:hypothetical protein